ncbi:MAG: hypothetical protein WKF75_01160 [Singulisphaera sp.]
MTISEVIDLTILLRPPPALEPAHRQQMASAGGQGGGRDGDLDGGPRIQVRRVAGKVVVACSPELAAFAESWRKADRLAESDLLPPPCGSSRNSTR